MFAIKETNDKVMFSNIIPFNWKENKKNPSYGSLPVFSAVAFQQIEHDKVEPTISLHLWTCDKELLAGSDKHNNSILS